MVPSHWHIINRLHLRRSEEIRNSAEDEVEKDLERGCHWDPSFGAGPPKDGWRWASTGAAPELSGAWQRGARYEVRVRSGVEERIREALDAACALRISSDGAPRPRRMGRLPHRQKHRSARYLWRLTHCRPVHAAYPGGTVVALRRCPLMVRWRRRPNRGRG